MVQKGITHLFQVYDTKMNKECLKRTFLSSQSLFSPAYLSKYFKLSQHTFKNTVFHPSIESYLILTNAPVKLKSTNSNFITIPENSKPIQQPQNIIGSNSHKGLGVCSATMINAGEFVCEYIGELNNSQSPHQSKNNYILTFVENYANGENDKTTIDANKYALISWENNCGL